MAGWISSKLKVAENLLQQIDQQAADSLGNTDKPRPSSSPSDLDSFTANLNQPPLAAGELSTSAAKFPLLKKSTPDLPKVSSFQSLSKPPSPDPTLIDWTELLSSPSPTPIVKKKPVLLKKNGKSSYLSSSSKSLEITTDLNRSKEEGAKEKPFSQTINVSAKRSSGTESSSGSDSEEEEERRKRRDDMLAEKLIKEKEDIVARLEGEKQSLEKILEERERRQAKEASELQMSMIETMEAVDVEKQKHNSTRMEALALLAQLEARNSLLSESLAAEQWKLEVALNRVGELRQQIGLKELAQEEHRRRISAIKKQAFCPGTAESLRKDRAESEILDVECSFICDKIAKLKDKARWLEENIGKTKGEILQTTDVEVELKKRLSQLTDHLIQKQSQVESLSSEKSALVFRIEKLMLRTFDENGLLSLEDGECENLDIEYGRWQRSDYATKEALRERIRSGRQQLGLFIRQLDAIFSAGAMFVRRNTMAQLFSFFYLICLHLWVLYILMSHSQVSDGASQGDSSSLETISNSSGH